MLVKRRKKTKSSSSMRFWQTGFITLNTKWREKNEQKKTKHFMKRKYFYACNGSQILKRFSLQFGSTSLNSRFYVCIGIRSNTILLHGFYFYEREKEKEKNSFILGLFSIKQLFSSSNAMKLLKWISTEMKKKKLKKIFQFFNSGFSVRFSLSVDSTFVPDATSVSDKRNFLNVKFGEKSALNTIPALFGRLLGGNNF